MPLGCQGSTSGFSRVSEPGPYEALPGEVVVLESDHDGAAIQIGVVRPDVPAGQRVPVIAFASPYLFGGLDDESVAGCVPRLTLNFLPHGYAIALVAVRGTADSGGCSDLMGIAERSDLNQAVTWLGEQEWSNGNVGMLGVSYDGSTPWAVASMGNPHLKTIVPISGVNDPYHLMYRNGGPENRGLLILNALYYTFGFASYNPFSGRSTAHTIDGAACPEAARGFGAAAYSYTTGERDPLGYWDERNMRPGVEERYRGSILLVHGLQDWNVDPGHAYPWVSELEARGITVKHLLGQWAHAWPDGRSHAGERWDWADMLLAWFDRWLKEDQTADIGAGAEVQDTSGRWRAEPTWPPAEATEMVLHLHPDGTLRPEPPAEGGLIPIPPADPTPVVCDGCAAFHLDLDEDLLLTGWPELRLRVIPTGAGGHVTATLYQHFLHYPPDRDDLFEVRWRLGWGQADLRFPDGGERAQAVIPGMPVDLLLRIQPLDAVFEAGRPLVLVLHQGTDSNHDRPVTSAPVLLDLSSATFRALAHQPDPASFFTPPTRPAGE